MRTLQSGMRITVSGALPGAMAWLGVGAAAQTSYGGVPLPLALDPYGLQGCSLYVSPAAIDIRTTGVAGFDRGYAAIDLAARVNAASTNAFAAQWLVLDPATLGFGVSARHEFRVQ
jgi:hypothetical protein